VTWLVDDLNREMMSEATAEAQQSIYYLTDQLENTQIVALEQVFYGLIEEQTKTIMLANSRAEYLFETIDPAIAPERRVRPNRTLICILGTLLGGMLGALSVLIQHYAFRSGHASKEAGI
jgi:LPS O-antigen subunit length determinant protein (WzzB/FepE family)